MPDVYVSNLLRMKSFHGVLARNVHKYSLKLSSGKVRIVRDVAELIPRKALSAASEAISATFWRRVGVCGKRESGYLSVVG